MNTLTLTLGIILAAAATADLWAVMARDLMMLQQNSYRRERYLRWFEDSAESTNLGRILCCVALLFMLVNRFPSFAAFFIAAVVTLWQLFTLSTRSYKKPLVWTQRAGRLFAVMWLLAASVATIFWIFLGFKAFLCALMGILVLSPVILLGANLLLSPVEKAVNRHFYDDAASILRSMPELKIIGITGSFGKTSTKHYLQRILSEHYSTLMTPGSFNTPMGVIRTTRELLRPYHQVFIVEMGAKQPGDIKEICDLVHPSIGIVTAVGEQHLESFHNLENVQRTKFELVDALPSDGLAVVNNDFPYIANRPVSNVRCLRYSVTDDDSLPAHYRATDIRYDASGAAFNVTGPGLKEPLQVTTHLVGECNISNLVAAIAVAVEMGMPLEKIRYAVARIEQVEHRLNMRRNPSGITVIDDAFNANPSGARMALDTLALVGSGKKIVITPGMIELGPRQYEANKEFGQHMAQRADVAIVVGKYNRDAIVEGLLAGHMDQGKIHAVDTFAEAQSLLPSLAKPGDVVLYENDLPDTFK